MSKLVKIKYKDDTECDIHLISFIGGKTICGAEYLGNDNVEELEYITGTVKKVNCPYCSQLIDYIKKVK